MSTWRIDQFGKKPDLKRPVFVEGLPGIGNVGKVVMDFMVDELDAKKLFEVTSSAFPHSVFVNEDNLVELPKIHLYYKRHKGGDLLLMAGDVQPIDEGSSYEFSEKILDMIQDFNPKEIITLGGIGLAEIPKQPKVFCTGNSREIVDRYTSKTVQNKLYGVVGPIVGVSGLLLGLASRRNIQAVSLLAETYGHPLYLGVKGARELLKVLNYKLKLDIDVNKLEKEIKYIEKQIVKRTEDLGQAPLKGAMRKPGEVSYIG